MIKIAKRSIVWESPQVAMSSWSIRRQPLCCPTRIASSGLFARFQKSKQPGQNRLGIQSQLQAQIPQRLTAAGIVDSQLLKHRQRSRMLDDPVGNRSIKVAGCHRVSAFQRRVAIVFRQLCVRQTQNARAKIVLVGSRMETLICGCRATREMPPQPASSMVAPLSHLANQLQSHDLH